MDGIEGFVPKNGEGAGGESTNEKRAEQTWRIGDGEITNIVFGAMRIIESFVNDRENGFEVGASGDFGNDTSVGSKNINLRNDDVAEDLGGGVRIGGAAKIADDGSGSFVAGSFESENFHGVIIAFFDG